MARPMDDLESALGRASPNPPWIPEGLSFERIIKNETEVPCSLNDFMDYLVYVERRAEDLQFFLWFYNYIPRWQALEARQKTLSPPWEPGKIKHPKAKFLAYRHRRARSEKMNNILDLIDKETGVEKDEALPFQCPPIKTTFSPDDDFAQPGPPPRQNTSPVERPKPDWFTVQPFRNEYCGVVKHYIVETSPRALKLNPKDREWCLEAAPHTTHPSALLPAFMAVEDNLRNNLHPNFIRWIRSNSNNSSMLFLRTIGATLFVLGTALSIVLILSSQTRFLRIVCLVFWLPGLIVFTAAWKNLCLLLHFRDVRELRPWEMYPADPETAVKDVYTPSPVLSAEEKEGGFTFSRKNTGDSVATNAAGSDPLRKASMRTFGPKNDYNHERWYNLYSKRSLWSKILDKTTPVQNPTLRAMQDRTIFYSVLWGGLVATALTAGSLCFPEFGIIM